MRLYIDPGTGSMLFSILIGVIGAAFYFLRGLVIKLKYSFSNGKTEKLSDNCLKYVIYSESKRYWNIFKPICDEFERREIDVDYFTSDPKDPALEAGYQHIRPLFIGEGNRGFTKLNLLNATIVLSTTPSLDVYQWKRSKNVKYYVHIAHMPNDITTYEMFGLDHYDAILLSGDYQIEQIRKLVGKLPIFGICLGHQLLALAMGGRTTKLKYGHRGANQPVTDLVGVHTYITSQNHGYAVVSESLGGIGRVTFENANDHTCEGVDYPGMRCFSVQFHPEACAGPLDTQFLFDRFISMMGGEN